MGDALHVGEQGGEQAAGAALRGGEAEIALRRLLEQPARRLLGLVGEDGGKSLGVVHGGKEPVPSAECSTGQTREIRHGGNEPGRDPVADTRSSRGGGAFREVRESERRRREGE